MTFEYGILIAMVWCSEVCKVYATGTAAYSSYFVLAEHGKYKTVQHRAIASLVQETRRHCAAACLQEDRCWQFCYGPSTGQCILEDASFMSLSGRGTDNCTYYNRRVCNSSYRLTSFHQHVFPFPAFNEEFVLDASVQCQAFPMIILSEDGTKAGTKYQIILGGTTKIRRCTQCSVLKSVQTPGLVSQYEMRRLWMRYNHGTFLLGRHNDAPFLQWTDPTPVAAQFVGFSNWGKPATWVAHHTCE
ncbi:uncharacterized protein LOC110975491 [Acanthaster planci]|uniref:Uncharacterized protein LOC110975491 n=1 Tax=Acanthaster planci TaxID=133434 RepID=A0A8B7XS84_ACAPL|nr:uncharacterized protein LOC110975491 [Acanthaster planci]